MNVEATAYHEAGHAVMTAACNRKIYSATIIPRDDAHGSVEHENPLRGIKLKFNNGYPARLRAEDAVMICLAGGIAQLRAFPRLLRRWHTHTDYVRAVEIARSICGSPDEATAFLKWLDLRMRSILDVRWFQVEAVAAALVERKRLTGAEIASLMTAALPSRQHVLRPSRAILLFRG